MSAAKVDLICAVCDGTREYTQPCPGCASPTASRLSELIEELIEATEEYFSPDGSYAPGTYSSDRVLAALASIGGAA